MQKSITEGALNPIILPTVRVGEGGASASLTADENMAYTVLWGRLWPHRGRLGMHP